MMFHNWDVPWDFNGYGPIDNNIDSSQPVHQLSRMRTVTSVSAMQRLAKSWQRQGVRVGFVPTMGYLHAGHMSLVKRARQIVGGGGKVVVSIYVNPTQFGPGEDLSRYPRDLQRDKNFCRAEGVDVVFVPTNEEMYPHNSEGKYSTYVVEEALSRGMEGASRPTHFRGVTTIVAKLFNIVQPQVAVFGAKDFQQAAVVQRMVRDLNFPLKIVVAPTHREPDGLAMSSRNKYLSPEERPQALALSLAIKSAHKAVRDSKRPLPAEQLRKRLAGMISERPSARVDYIEFFDPQTLQPVAEVTRGTQMALAVFVGKTRLIDNARL
jgi:pantoate--beta-alanine ligase